MRRLLIDLRRRGQSTALRLLRSSPAFPKTLVDRLGEDASLTSARLDAEVMVYFPGAPDTLYQIVPWLPTFEAVHDAHRAVIVLQDSRVAAELRRRSRIPVVTVARYGTLDAVLARSDVKVALYVSHLPRNFEALRFASLLHAYIGHGDSDKGVSASNQLKAYDLFLAPGQAAVDRVAQRLMRFDPAERTVVVGQPTTLSPPPEAGPAEDARTTVLYAPTWEGAQPSVAYSSVESLGVALVGALLADGRYRVLYRPHPLTGVMLRGYAVADAAIRDRLAAAGGDHATVPADAEPLEVTFGRAHVLVADVSGVATAWLPSLRPLLVTEAAGDAVAADSGLLAAVPRLAAADAAGAAALVAAVLDDAEGRAVREELVARYLSPYWPDRTIERFVEVVGGLVAERDRLRGALLEQGATGV